MSKRIEVEKREQNVRNTRACVHQAVETLRSLAFNMRARKNDQCLLEFRLAVEAVAVELSVGLNRYLPAEST